MGGQLLAHGVLGGFLTFQASRVRFRFSRTHLDVVFVEPFAPDAAALAADVDSSGNNKLQGGGANKWALASFTNWEFWWPGFPVLVYFKETQTRPEGAPLPHASKREHHRARMHAMLASRTDARLTRHAHD